MCVFVHRESSRYPIKDNFVITKNVRDYFLTFANCSNVKRSSLMESLTIRSVLHRLPVARIVELTRCLLIDNCLQW